MSLSARIAFGPSIRLEGLATAVAVGGFVVAAATLGAPSADATVPWTGVAVLAAMLWIVGALRRHRSAPRSVMTVSDRLEVGLASTSSAIDGGAWRLDRTSLVWPGFAVVALRDDEGRSPIRLCVLAAERTDDDRRALQRWLLWVLRGGRDPRKSAA